MHTRDCRGMTDEVMMARGTCCQRHELEAIGRGLPGGLNREDWPARAAEIRDAERGIPGLPHAPEPTETRDSLAAEAERLAAVYAADAEALTLAKIREDITR